MHYEKSEKIQEKITEMCKTPLTCGQIAQRLNYSPQRTIYHLRKLIADYRIIPTRASGRMTAETYTYQTNTDGVALHSLNKTVKKVVHCEKIKNSTFTEREKEIKARNEYKAGSAMLNVKDLAKKLQKTAELSRSKSSRTYVGISTVYNG